MTGNTNSGRRALAAAMPLSRKEDMFVREYLRDMSPGAAAVRAGYQRVDGARLLKRLNIARAVDALVAARSARVGITADRVLAELGNLAFCNPAELFRPDGTLKPWTDLTADQAKMIGGVKTRKSVELGEEGKPVPVEIVEYTFVNKLNALTLAMRHLGMFNDHLTVEVVSLADRLAAAQQRLLANGRALPGAEAEDAVIEGEFEEEAIDVEDLI